MDSVIANACKPNCSIDYEIDFSTKKWKTKSVTQTDEQE